MRQLQMNCTLADTHLPRTNGNEQSASVLTQQKSQSARERKENRKRKTLKKKKEKRRKKKHCQVCTQHIKAIIQSRCTCPLMLCYSLCPTHMWLCTNFPAEFSPFLLSLKNAQTIRNLFHYIFIMNLCDGTKTPSSSKYISIKRYATAQFFSKLKKNVFSLLRRVREREKKNQTPPTIRVAWWDALPFTVHIWFHFIRSRRDES